MSINSAAAYSRNVDPALKVMDSILQKYKELLKWNESFTSVIDLGIGDGRMAKEVIIPILPFNIKEFVGCDISNSALEHAKSIINLPTFKVIKMDISTLNMPPEMKERFTNIFSSFCLHNIKNTR